MLFRINLRKGLGKIVSVALISGSQVSQATTLTIHSDVEKILIDHSRYGGCLIYIDSSPANDTALSCTNTVSAISFDCTNTRGTSNKAMARAMLDSAYLNLLQPNTTRMTFRVTDEGGLPNGVCVADWAQLVPTP